MLTAGEVVGAGVGDGGGGGGGGGGGVCTKRKPVSVNLDLTNFGKARLFRSAQRGLTDEGGGGGGGLVAPMQ